MQHLSELQIIIIDANKQKTDMKLSALLHLSLIENVGPIAIMQLVAASQNSHHKLDIYSLSVSDLRQLCNYSAEKAQLIWSGLQDFEKLDKELQLIEKHNVDCISILDERYPELLKNIYSPPPILYCFGKVSLSSDYYIAVVGSRKADAYGTKVVQKLVPELVHNGWGIVSGGALGIDTIAHKETLAAGGITIAVLGSGLLRPYPHGNKELFRKIIEQGGAVISPFPLLMEPLAGNFPARNRVIAGMSRGCIVAQAADPSGALITAQFALNEGRDVFAVPGNIDNPLSAGCNKLISQGATLITGTTEVLASFGHASHQKTIPFENKTVDVTTESSSQTQKIIRLCTKPISFDELIIQTGIEEGVLRDILCDLSLEARVMQNRIGLWQVV